MIDWTATALAVRRANAAYLMAQSESKAAFEAIGDEWISLLSTDSHQAVVSRGAKGHHLSISGTRASKLMVLDVFADVSLEPASVAGGKVTEGVLCGMDDLWKWAKSLAPADAVWHVTGHSLGASRTHLTPLFVDVAHIGELHSFEAPKFANGDFYAAHAGALANMVCTLNGRDTWAAWPWDDSRWQYRPLNDHVWLKSDGYAMIAAKEWPGAGSFSDHDVDAVQARCAALAAAPLKPAA
jgi:hypothetical protein